jgi:hypothetical protein
MGKKTHSWMLAHPTRCWCGGAPYAIHTGMWCCKKCFDIDTRRQKWPDYDSHDARPNELTMDKNPNFETDNA